MLQLSLGIFTCFFSVALQTMFMPYHTSGENAFAFMTYTLTFLVMFVGLIGKLDSSKFEGADGDGVGMLLAVLTVFVIFLSALVIYFEIKVSAIENS